MKRVKISLIFVLIFAFLSLSFSAFAAQINSTSYKQTVVVSVGGENVSSPSYKMSIAIGIINGIINSTSFMNKLGFFHFLLLADNQPCTSASQCEGGFCCSNLCKSTACASPSPAPSGGGGGGAGAGGGGGGSLPTPIEQPKVQAFSVSPSTIKDTLSLGAAKTEQIIITNTGNTALDFSLSVATVNEFVSLSESSFSLGPGQAKTVDAMVTGAKLGSYLGEIQVSAGGITKSISIVVEVESEQVLFDAKMDIPSGYKKVEAGGELKAQITLLNVGSPRKVDVTTTYIIKDKRGNVIYESSETFAVEKQTSFVKSFNIPKELQPGDYLAIIEVTYEKSFAVSSELFSVVPKEVTQIQKAVKSNATLLYVLFVFVGALSLFAYLLLPRIKIIPTTKLDRLNKLMDDVKEAIERKDIAKAKKLYVNARKIYVGMKTKEKKEAYSELMRFYKKLR